MNPIDEIIDDIRKPRVELSSRFDHKLDQYFDYLLAQEAEEKKLGQMRFLEDHPEEVIVC